jgi:hypothetical protein
MKKLLLPLMLSAIMFPAMSMADAHSESGVTHKMEKHHHGDKAGMKKHKLKEMTPEQKEAFFDERISQMEAHSKQMSTDAAALKTMSLEEKEAWFKAKKEERHAKKGKMGKGKHKDMKGKCEKLRTLDSPKSPAEAMERLKASKRYQGATAEDKAAMEARVNKFGNMSEEERQAHFDKRKAKMEERCAKLEAK